MVSPSPPGQGGLQVSQHDFLKPPRGVDLGWACRICAVSMLSLQARFRTVGPTPRRGHSTAGRQLAQFRRSGFRN
jgi:hypothetical protein